MDCGGYISSGEASWCVSVMWILIIDWLFVESLAHWGIDRGGGLHWQPGLWHWQMPDAMLHKNILTKSAIQPIFIFYIHYIHSFWTFFRGIQENLLTLVVCVKGWECQVQINARVWSERPGMLAPRLADVFLVPRSRVLKPDLKYSDVILYSGKLRQEVTQLHLSSKQFRWRSKHTWTTRLLRPDISAILSKSWPSGLQSIWKFACRMWICSSVKVVRFRFDFLFLFLFVSVVFSQASPSVEEP